MNRFAVVVWGTMLGMMLAVTAYGGWADVVGRVSDSMTGTDTVKEQRGKGASNNEIIQGLKEALSLASKKAVRALGAENGFLKNPKVVIPVPEHLSMVAKGLEQVGQKKLVDDFVVSMNRAAEKAVPKATPVFLGAIKAMSLEDARKILNGKDDAATMYFKEHTQTELTRELAPLVKEATESVKVTSYLKAMQAKAGSMAALGGMKMKDIDEYVTQKALDGLFVIMAEQEAAVRKDPVGQGSRLLKKVFGFGT